MTPELIIFDESTAMLDPQGRREVVDIMQKLNRDEKITVINITHYMEEAAAADRVIVINDGRIAFDGTPREVFSNVERLREMGLETPQGNELILELTKLGVKITGESLTEEECVETLYKFLSQDRKS